MGSLPLSLVKARTKTTKANQNASGTKTGRRQRLQRRCNELRRSCACSRRSGDRSCCIGLRTVRLRRGHLSRAKLERDQTKSNKIKRSQHLTLASPRVCPCLKVMYLSNPSTTLHPLNALRQKGTAWRWTAACHQAFEKVKQQITSDLVLTHFYQALPLRLASDASPYGIDAVMSHVLPNGTERPIAFASRTLSTAERNYVQIDKEALAIVWAVRKFHTYLYGRNFVLVPDHNTFTAIFNPEKDLPAMTATRLQPYAYPLFLAGQRYSIEYGNTHKHSITEGMDSPACRSLV